MTLLAVRSAAAHGTADLARTPPAHLLTGAPARTCTAAGVTVVASTAGPDAATAIGTQLRVESAASVPAAADDQQRRLLHHHRPGAGVEEEEDDATTLVGRLALPVPPRWLEAISRVH